MDIDCCQNVRVSNCTVNSPWDDGICPKSSYALGYARPTRNLTISNCFVTGSYELGSVLDGTFKKFARDFRVPRTGRIKCGTESNGGFINIAITNTTMRDLVSGPIFMRLGSRLRGPKESTKVGTLTVSYTHLAPSPSSSRSCSPNDGSLRDRRGAFPVAEDPLF